MSASLDLLPWPKRLARGHGSLAPNGFNVVFPGFASERLNRAVSRSLGAPGSTPLSIACARRSTEFPALGDDESYRLEVTPSGVVLTATEEWGALHGLTTLALLARERESIPTLSIEDAPRFPWRGLLLDVARRFMSVAALERTLDGMAAAKLNVLHLHLTDDQGFRFPSEAFPGLPLQGGAGVFYSRDELRALVAYAAERGIRVVPEIDVPGHCTSWLAAHPEWGAKRRRLAPSRRFGVHKACLDPSNDAVFSALATLFAEVAEVFPDAFVHVGGDEVHPAWWQSSARVRRWMAREDLPDVASAQAAFGARLAPLLDSVGRRMVGWDEVLHERLPRGTLVQSWRGAVTRDRVLDAGFDCLFSAGYYLDVFYPADVHYRFDPEAPPEALERVEAELLDDPRLAHVRDGIAWSRRFARRSQAPPADPERPRGRVLGGEACLWSELVNEALLDVRLWSRLPAVAERLWSPREVDDAHDMTRRLDAFQQRLPVLVGVDLEKSVRREFTSRGVSEHAFEALRPLLDVLEPVKWYARLLGPEALAARVAGDEAPTPRPYSVSSRLDGTADILRPESPWARDFGARLDGGTLDVAATAHGWREQRTTLRRLAPKQRWLAELQPLSEALAGLADVLEGRIAGAAADGLLTRAAEPVADLLIAIVPALETHVRRT